MGVFCGKCVFWGSACFPRLFRLAQHVLCTYPLPSPVCFPIECRGWLIAPSKSHCGFCVWNAIVCFTLSSFILRFAKYLPSMFCWPVSDSLCIHIHYTCTCQYTHACSYVYISSSLEIRAWVWLLFLIFPICWRCVKTCCLSLVSLQTCPIVSRINMNPKRRSTSLVGPMARKWFVLTCIFAFLHVSTPYNNWL